MSKLRLARISRHLMYHEVAESIHELIKREGLWERYLAPERELAVMFGVSRETVRRGLEVLKRQGVVSRRHGRGTLVLAKPQARQGGSRGRVVIGSYSPAGDASGYTGQMMAGMTGAASAAGLLFSFANLATPASRQECFAELTGAGVDGLLLLSFTDRSLIEEILGCWRGPTVLVDHYFDGLPVTGVVDDSEGGARQAVEHFLSLGHRRIAYVEISRRELNPWRYDGYAGALRDAGIEVDEQLVVPSYGSFDSGRQAGERLLTLPDPPTAIFAFDDQRAWGIWRAAEARGLQVGRDLALVGFGDGAARAGFPEELSSVRFRSRELGRLAVEELGELIAGRSTPGKLLKVPTELVIRVSSEDARPGAARPGKGGRQ